MTNMEKAVAAWGASLPDWVKALAEGCDEKSLRKTAAKLELSPAMCSLAINRGRENLDFVKARVESRLMVTTLTCPVLGVINHSDCLREQAKPFNSGNPLGVRLFRACREGCIYFKQPKKEEESHVKPTVKRPRG